MNLTNGAGVNYVLHLGGDLLGYRLTKHGDMPDNCDCNRRGSACDGVGDDSMGYQEMEERKQTDTVEDIAPEGVVFETG